jgi:hypothetical protein
MAMVALMNRVRERIISLLGSGKPLYDRLYEVVVAHFRATTTLDLEGFMRESRTTLSLDQVNEIKLAEESMYVSIEQAFLDAIEAGDIPKIHAKFAAHSFVALIKVGNYKLPDGTGFFPVVEETAEQVMSVFWRGFIGSSG